MNIVSLHKRDLQLVIQYLSIARITGLSEELRFFSANPNVTKDPIATHTTLNKLKTALFFSFLVV